MNEKLRAAYELIKSVDAERAERLRALDRDDSPDETHALYNEQRTLSHAWDFMHAFECWDHSLNKSKAEPACG